MSYAVIKAGGKQYLVSEGDVIEVDKLEKESGIISFSEVLLVLDNSLKVGKPFVNGVSVEGQVLGSKRGDKIRVSKFKAKARYRRTKGHRSTLSRVQINSIGGSIKEKKQPVKKVKPSSKK